jgi:hypothetical protein
MAVVIAYYLAIIDRNYKRASGYLACLLHCGPHGVSADRRISPRNSRKSRNGGA